MKKGESDMKNKYSLVGIDGNAYSIMGYVKRCMREVGISQEEQLTYIEDATDSDYHHLLYISSEMVDKCNRYANGLQELYDFVDAL